MSSLESDFSLLLVLGTLLLGYLCWRRLWLGVGHEEQCSLPAKALNEGRHGRARLWAAVH
eukprot:5258377-Karenia_brevis.AAC.1